MFKKKTNQSTEIKKNENIIKYLKPKILLVDLDETAEKNLRDKGYNVSSGSFGNPYKVPVNDSYLSVIYNGKLPNITEQEILVVDLKPPLLLGKSDGEKETSDGEDDWWACCCEGMIDPRPRAMSWSARHIERILGHGGVLIIFAESRVCQKLKFGHIDRDYRNLTGENIDRDNWCFSGCLKESFIKIKSDFGNEMFPVQENTIFIEIFRKYLSGSKFSCVIDRGYNIDEKKWHPLIKNKYDNTVSVAVPFHADGDKNAWILIFPQIKDKAGFIVELFDILPNFASHLFPYYEGNLWLNKPEYQMPVILELQDEIENTKAACDKKISEIKDGIKKEKEKNRYLYDLIRETDRVLVEAVMKALGVLGFNQIVDVDTERKDDPKSNSLREDIRIEDTSPMLVVDVKGITGKPSDPDSNQSHKHATIRMKEMKRTDVNSLTIINHQRNIPPLDRDNNMPYRKELLDGASQIDLGLMTTWDLYRLVRSFLRNNWKPEYIKPLLYRCCRISIIPTNYEYAGFVTHIWEKAEAFGIKIEAGKLYSGDTIGIETEIEICEYDIVSMKLEDKAVTESSTGNEIGVKTHIFPNDIRKGYRVYKVKKN